MRIFDNSIVFLPSLSPHSRKKTKLPHGHRLTNITTKRKWPRHGPPCKKAAAAWLIHLSWPTGWKYNSGDEG